MKHKKQFILTAGFSAAATLGLVAALGFAQPDGIDPPAGPVTDTQPSLASIEMALDDIATKSAMNELTQGPWQSLHVQVGADQLSSIQITDGPTLVHKLIAYSSYLTAFDGPGSMEVRGGNPSGDVVAQVNSVFVSTSINTAGETFDVIAENGLHIAWDSDSITGTIQVLYKELP